MLSSLLIPLGLLVICGGVYALFRKKWFYGILVVILGLSLTTNKWWWPSSKTGSVTIGNEGWVNVPVDTNTPTPPEPNWLLRKWSDVFTSGEQQPIPISREVREMGNPDLASPTNYRSGKACGEVKTPLKPDDVVIAQQGNWSGPVNFLRKFAIE